MQRPGLTSLSKKKGQAKGIHKRGARMNFVRIAEKDIVAC
jgi:hypothetical protein